MSSDASSLKQRDRNEPPSKKVKHDSSRFKISDEKLNELKAIQDAHKKGDITQEQATQQYEKFCRSVRTRVGGSTGKPWDARK